MEIVNHLSRYTKVIFIQFKKTNPWIECSNILFLEMIQPDSLIMAKLEMVKMANEKPFLHWKFPQQCFLVVIGHFETLLDVKLSKSTAHSPHSVVACLKPNLYSGIRVAPWINVAQGTFGEKNKHNPFKKTYPTSSNNRISDFFMDYSL